MGRPFRLQILMALGAVPFVFLVFAGKPKQQPSELIIRSEARLVLLDASVTNHEGGYVSGLAQSAFSVFENGKLQQITVFANEDRPVTVGIIVDESYSMTPKRNDVLSAAETFIQASNPYDEMFVLNFNDTVKRGLPPQIPFSDDIRELRSALQRGLPQGKTALYDAVVDGLKQLEQGRREKKALIVISDGGDNASFHKRSEMLDMVEKSIATIYSIGLFSPGDPDRNPGILKKLARISGGEAYFPEDPSEMLPVCRRIAKDIRARYTIGYVPLPGNGTVRDIRVHVSAPAYPRLSVHTRASYRYEPIENQETN